MNALKSLTCFAFALAWLAVGGVFAFEGLETMGQSARAVPFSFISFGIAFLCMRAIERR